MRRKNIKFTALGTVLALSAALVMTGPAVWASDDEDKAEAVQEEMGAEEAEAAADEDSDFDESEAVPAGEADSEEPFQDAEGGAQELTELEYLQQFLESSIDTDLTNVLIEMSDEDIDKYIENSEGFSKAAPEAWKGVKDELGKRVSDEVVVTVTEEDKIYTATQNVKFEKADADFIYTFDKTMAPTDLVINVNYPMSVTLERAGLNTLMGLGTVFIMLVFLSLVISLFKFIPNGSKKKAVQEEASPVPVRASEPEPVYEEETDDQELIAVIAAAIAAAEGTTPDGFVVRSVRRAGRTRR